MCSHRASGCFGEQMRVHPETSVLVVEELTYLMANIMADCGKQNSQYASLTQIWCCYIIVALTILQRN